MLPVQLVVLGFWVMAGSLVLVICLILSQYGIWSIMVPGGSKGLVGRFATECPLQMWLFRAGFALGGGIVAAGVLTGAFALVSRAIA